MINKLIEKYDHELNKIAIIGGNHESDVLNIQYDTYKKFIQDLEELKKTQLQNLNEVKEYLGSQKVTPEMVAIAMRKIEISILGVDTDE